MSIIRDVTIQSEPYWDNDEILLFIGPRQAGKTTILRQIEKGLKDRDVAVHWLSLEDPEYRVLLNDSVKNLFQIIPYDSNRKNVVFIDEIQYLDDPSHFLKYLYDEYRDTLKVIVSGSSAFYIDEKFTDSLVGRKRIFNVYTVSFAEFLRFKGEVTLEAAYKSGKLALIQIESVSRYYSEFMTYGGFPKVVLAPLPEKENLLRELAYSYVKKDISDAGVRHEDVFYKLMKILAAQTGNLVNASELANTLRVSKTAIDHYLHILQKSFHIVLIRPFSRSMRTELTKMPKVFWVDMGLRNFLTGDATPFATRPDDDKGPLLENAFFRQLLEKNYRDDINFWRTKDGQEIDFVVKKQAYEVKALVAQFKPHKYQAFQKLYSDMDFSLVTFDKTTDKIHGVPVKNVWDA